MVYLQSLLPPDASTRTVLKRSLGYSDDEDDVEEAASQNLKRMKLMGFAVDNMESE